jgi:hypothetical protein
MSILEKEIERKLCRRVARRGGLAFKFLSSVAGVPDRIIILSGDVFFVETKSPTGKTRKLQRATIRKMRLAGAEVHVIKTMNQIKDIIP